MLSEGRERGCKARTATVARPVQLRKTRERGFSLS